MPAACLVGGSYSLGVYTLSFGYKWELNTRLFRNDSHNCVLFDRTRWRCALVKMSLKASCLRCATSTPWWLRGESLDLKAGTGAIRSTPATWPSPSTSSTTIWRPTVRWGPTAPVRATINWFEDEIEWKSERKSERERG